MSIQYNTYKCAYLHARSCVMHTYAHLQCLETKAWSSEHLQTDKCSTCIAWTSDKSWLNSQARYALGEDFRKEINWLPRAHPRSACNMCILCPAKPMCHTHMQTPSEQFLRCVHLTACNQLRLSLLIAIPSQHQPSTTILHWEPLAKSSVTYISGCQCNNLVENWCWYGIASRRVSCKKEGENIVGYSGNLLWRCLCALLGGSWQA